MKDSDPNPGPKHILATSVVGVVLILFLMGVFVFAPDDIPDFKQRVLAIFAAIVAGLFAFFLTGSLGISGKLRIPLLSEISWKAANGIALFTFILIWWLSPLSPVEVKEKSGEHTTDSRYIDKNNGGKSMETTTVQSQSMLPKPGEQVLPSSDFDPIRLIGIKAHANNPFHIDFIIDKGDSKLEGEKLNAEIKKIIEYFLTSLTIPEKEMWVNLSPYESDYIISDYFASTRMGHVFLEQDYLLKQLTATLTYPENDIGDNYWKTIFEETQKKYATQDMPVNTFNKVWIIPGEASLEEVENGHVLISNSSLKVLADLDYVALAQNVDNSDLGLAPGNYSQASDLNKITSDVAKRILIPKIEQDVNRGKNFSALRQVYNSLILAAWFKNRVKESLLNHVYVDKVKLGGLSTDEGNYGELIYQQYIKAFKKGVYEYIKEDYDPVTQEIVPRKYFSGGINADNISKQITDAKVHAKSLKSKMLKKAVILAHVMFLATGINSAQSIADQNIAAAPEQTISQKGGIDFGRIAQLNISVNRDENNVPLFDKETIEQITKNLGGLTAQLNDIHTFDSLSSLLEYKH